MLNWLKDKDKYKILIDSSYYSVSDIPFSELFIIDGNDLVFLDNFENEIQRYALSQELHEYLRINGKISCYFKLKNGLGYNIKRDIEIKP